MKKVLALALALVLALGCASFAMAEEEKPLIGILAPATTHGWVGGVAYFAEQAAEELDLNYVMLTSSTADEMSSQIEQLISMDVKAIVVWPQFTGVEVAAEMALEQGIIIYNFDMIIDVDEKYADLMYTLTGDNEGMGVEGANYIAEKLDGQGKVLVLNNPGAGNVNDDRLLAPDSMIDEVCRACERSGQDVPRTIGELMRCVYLSLAQCYAHSIADLEVLTGRTFTSLNVVGGGSQDGYLSELTTRACGIPLYAGPTEGTALGNLAVQMIADGLFDSVADLRTNIAESFNVVEYHANEEQLE